MGMGDENCLIQINGGYFVLDAQGDGVDSNGSVEITGGVNAGDTLLVGAALGTTPGTRVTVRAAGAAPAAR